MRAERIKGEAAKSRLQQLLNAGTFSLMSGFRDEDRYGRKLRTVTRSGRAIATRREGLAMGEIAPPLVQLTNWENESVADLDSFI